MHMLINVNRADKRPLQVQLYDSIRELIISGALKAGKQLPSSRSLSEQLGIARNTVTLAYERLSVEDYIAARPKTGIFVNEIPDTTFLVERPDEVSQARCVHLKKKHVSSGRALEAWSDRRTRPQFDFAVGRPHAKSFPASFWQRSAAHFLAHSRGLQTEYGDPRGLDTLRKAVADHLGAARGIDADPDQVMITSGVQGALNVLARLFLDGSDQSVAVENPCYQGAAFLFRSYGAHLYPIELDDRGLIVSQLGGFSGNLVYVTPSHQFPTGCTLSHDRRLQLLDWAYQTGSYVIEDDYDSDFRYDGPPLTALAGLDRREHVIYLGTFSKSIGAGIRVGYAVLPPHLLDQARSVKTLLDIGAPWLEQAIVADFLNKGAFLQHLRGIRRMYMGARDALIESIEQFFPGGALLGRECGMHVMWTLPPYLPAADEMQNLALNCGVGLYPLQRAGAHEYGSLPRYRDRSLVIGYAALSEAEIRTAIARLATVIGKRAS
ncbi:GntR family transcriptional regulator/MocR family aminotransferase [Bradyrhizobium sp. AZCC 2262]|uniref:MocR-like pyridoxine biosynthesis transcription factor PdxR n=1 Tax=Bradyrhizobium sp. AZCC 2262 TaxID=3117022 RepID=UPI002FEF8B53